tara:strand:- start:538 stop:834 length:297 start_codon:yes stop_codon:yes gene_type:complete
LQLQHTTQRVHDLVVDEVLTGIFPYFDEIPSFLPLLLSGGLLRVGRARHHIPIHEIRSVQVVFVLRVGQSLGLLLELGSVLVAAPVPRRIFNEGREQE